MTTAKHVTFALAITLCALLASAQAQTPRINSINITAESDKVHVSAQGDVTEMRVEVADEAGDVIFESGAITGHTLDWKMTDAQGVRVAAGTYLVTVTFRPATGKLRKRVEQVTVSDEKNTSKEKTSASAASHTAQSPTTTSATTGQIAKFTSPSSIGDSIITESAGRIGVATSAPISTLTVQTASENYGLLHTAALVDGGTVQVGTWAGAGSAGALSGWFGTRTKHPLRFFTNNSGSAMTILTNNNVGIGTLTPTTKLEVKTETATTAVRGVSNGGTAIYGVSPGGRGVFGLSTTSTGVEGRTGGSTSAGVYGSNFGGGYGVYGRGRTGVEGAGLGPNTTALAITNGAIKVTGAGVGTNTAVFVLVKNSSACSPSQVGINNPYTNNDPNAILFVTPSLVTGQGGNALSSAITVVYYTDQTAPVSCPELRNRWAIFYNNPQGIVDGTRFNVMVVKP